MKVQTVPKPGHKEILVLIVEDEEWREIHSAIFGKKPAFLNEYATLQDLNEHFQQLEWQGAKRFVLRRLALRNRHSAELSAALAEKLVDPKVGNLVIEDCVQQGYVNDFDWADSVVKRSIQQKKGPKAIKMKLKAKGLGENEIQQAMAGYSNPEEIQENIQRLLQTRYKSKDLSDFKERQKVIGSLFRKGYDFEDIRRALDGLGELD